MKYRNLLFDLDGTLTDSRPGIINALRYAFARLGMEAPEDRLTQFIGPPLRDSFIDVCRMERAAAERAVSAYRTYYNKRGVFENALYEGVPHLLSCLKAQGARIMLATSKPEPTALLVLEHFSLRSFFDFVGAAEQDGPRSRKEDVIRFTLESTGCLTEHTVMIGDRRYDIEGARAVGLDAVGAAYGYGGREELERAGACAVADDVSGLERLLLQGKPEQHPGLR